jgi:hypothetical protein
MKWQDIPDSPMLQMSTEKDSDFGIVRVRPVCASALRYDVSYGAWRGGGGGENIKIL